MIDYATRYPEAVALASNETERVAEALIAMFSRVGIPSEMLIENESALRELWSVEETDEHARLTYQYVIDLRERLEKTCKLAQDNVRKLDIKQNAFYDKRARSRKFDVGD